MKKRNPQAALTYILNRIAFGIWAPAVTAITLAVALATLLGWADRNGWAAAVREWGGVFAFSPMAASELVGTLSALYVALVALYFSITLLIITLAAQSLGVRLAERWIPRADIRATLAMLLALTSYSVVTSFLVDAASEPVPRVTIMLLLLATPLALAWIAYSFHRLARTAHVDTSITAIGDDLVAEAATVRSELHSYDDMTPPVTELHAERSGYLKLADLPKLSRRLEKRRKRLHLTLRPGSFVTEGECIAVYDGDDDDEELRSTITRHLAISDYRTDDPQSPFGMALLVEIACRALSPSVNDFLTAASAADQIGRVLEVRLRHPDGENEGPVRIRSNGFLERSLLHLAALRKDARAQPFVTVHLLKAYERGLRALPERAESEPVRELLLGLAGELHEEASERASKHDRPHIAKAFAACLLATESASDGRASIAA